MTLTAESTRRIAVILFALAIALVGFWGNQRQVEADTLADEILCEVDQELGDLPFDFEEECNGDEENPPPPPPVEEDSQCSDNIDNDGDGLTDWGVPEDENRDPGCSTPTDDSEDSDTPPPPPPPPADEPQCDDGLDNDNDGLWDMEDPGCSDLSDDDETDTPPSDTGGGDTPPSDTSSGGGNHRNGGGSYKKTGLVLGVEDCSQYLNEFMRFGQSNNEAQVRRLQLFLQQFEKMEVAETGVFDAATLAAVHAFQAKYAGDILTPWGIGKSTGYVYLTTRKKVNELYCKETKQFPLSQSEEQHINQVRAGGGATASVRTSPSGSVTSQVDLTAQTGAALTDGNGDEEHENETATTSARSGRGFWNSIGDFFSRVLRLGR